MPSHQVEVILPRRKLTRSDVIFDVKVDGETRDALHVSRGAVVWFPANNKYGHRLTWSRFAWLMEHYGARAEKR